MKVKRLGEASREALLGTIDSTVNGKFPLLPGRFSERLLAGYTAKFREGVMQGLHELRAHLEKQRADLQAPFEGNTRILASLATLDETAVTVGDELNKIAMLEGALPPEKTVRDLAPAIEANAAESVPQVSAAS